MLSTFMKFFGVTSLESKDMLYSSESIIMMVVMSSELSSANKNCESMSASGRFSSSIFLMRSYMRKTLVCYVSGCKVTTS